MAILERNDVEEGELSDAVLGVLSFGDRVAALSTLVRADGKALPPSLVSEFLLGLISFRQTLRANVALAAVSDGGVTAGAGSAHDPLALGSLLR